MLRILQVSFRIQDVPLPRLFGVLKRHDVVQRDLVIIQSTDDDHATAEHECQVVPPALGQDEVAILVFEGLRIIDFLDNLRLWIVLHDFLVAWTYLLTGLSSLLKLRILGSEGVSRDRACGLPHQLTVLVRLGAHLLGFLGRFVVQ